MSEVGYLILEDLLGLVRRINVGPVRDIGLLDAAVTRPRSSAFGADAYPSIELKAAALLHSLVRNHALVDGNERLGWLATVVFLDLNGRSVGLEDDEAFDLVIATAEGRLDVEEMAERLSRRQPPTRTPGACRRTGGPSTDVRAIRRCRQCGPRAPLPRCRGATATPPLPGRSPSGVGRRDSALGALNTYRTTRDGGTVVLDVYASKEPMSAGRALIADDEEDIRLLLQLWLPETTSADIVGEATDGNEALDLWRRLRPEVVVLDDVMPGMTGEEVARRIKDEDPDVRVIVFTGYYLDRLRDLTRDYPDVELVRKPDLHGLSALVDALFE